MLAEGVPGQLQHLQDVPLGDGLLDPAGEDRSRALLRPPCGRLAEFGHGLVGGQQHDPGLLQLVLDFGAEVGAPRDPLHRLAHHRHEPAVGALGFGEQVLDTSVAGDRDVERLVCVTAAPVLQGHPAGFDVVEMRDDHAVGGQRVAGAVELARQRQRRVLLVIGGGPA
ncbi:hypothetical protein AB0L06_21855 [Spirillospora sp. NPDC052269]